MDWLKAAQRLGISVPEGATPEEIRALVCKALNRSESTPDTELKASLKARGPVIPQARGDWWQIRAAASDRDVAELLIYGDIGESFWEETVTAQAMVQQLQQVTAGTVRIRINSRGGSVTDGIAIYNALRAHPARVEAVIEAEASSIASMIPMAADHISMASNAGLMIHAPWARADGNAKAFRRFADQLDFWATNMAQAYARKSGQSMDDIMALLDRDQDVWFHAEQAKAEGFVDEVTDALPMAAQALRASRFSPPQAFHATAQPTPSSNAAAAAHSSTQEHITMNLKAIAKSLGITIPSGADEAAIRALICAKLKLEAAADDSDIVQALAEGAGRVQAAQRSTPNDPPFQPAELTREEEIDQICALAAGSSEDAGFQRKLKRLQASAKVDTAKSVAEVRAKVMKLLADDDVEPVAGRHTVQAGEDASDKRVEAASNWLLVRAGVVPRDHDAQKTLGENPFKGFSAADIAREVLESAGISARGMGRIEVIKSAIQAAGNHTTSDFPNIFENALHKTLILGAQSANPTWEQFCAQGSLSDFRPHNRYRAGSFGDLLPVNEAGEFKSGTIGDAEKESIQGQSRGRILNITREMLINDDMSVFSRIAFMMGQGAERTIDKAVFALFALNGGNGPTMGDSNPLFHDRGELGNNILPVAAAPDTPSVDAARQRMAQIKEPSGNDFLDIRPAIWLGPLSLGGRARQVNNNEREVSGAKNLTTDNYVRNTFRSVVDTPRLGAGAWYTFADPSIEPVIEVAFLDGMRNAQLEMEENFNTAGMSWRVIHDWAVGATGWRGANKTPTS